MNVKIWLGSYLRITNEICSIEQSIECIKNTQLGKAITYSVQPRSSDMRDLSSYVVRVERLELRLCELKSKCCKRLEQIEDAIEKVSDERGRAILRMHYIAGNGFEKIADELMYSEGYIFTIYNKALREVTKTEEFIDYINAINE